MINEIQNITAVWHGAMVNTISVSIGYAAHSDYPDAKIGELEKISDQRMYEDKSRYYQKSGVDRRQRYRT